MVPKISFRVGYGLVERSCLLLWTTGWAIGLCYALKFGAINWGEGRHAAQYTRTDDPGIYWAIIAVLVGICALGLALTFELSLKNDEETVADKDKE